MGSPPTSARSLSKRLGLGLVRGKPSKMKPLASVALFHHVADHADHHRPAPVPRRPSAPWPSGRGGLGLDLGAQQVAGAQVHQAVAFLDQEFALRALAGARRAEQDDVQFRSWSVSMMR
jgi:hypothetical protein